jgi:hypothetical protein
LDTGRSSPRGQPIALAGGIFASLLILAFSAGYGIFRDELYYWACAQRLAWGYVDHPPLSIGVLRLFGGHLLAMKVPGALAFGVSVYLMVRQSRLMGARAWGMSVTAVATALCPLLVAIAGLFSMNVLEIAFWAVGTSLSARLLIEPTPRRWLTFGLVVGLGLLNKYSMAMLPAGLVVGLLATPSRRQLLTPWPWIGGAIALAVFSPHAIWEIQHGNPSLEFMRRATQLKMTSVAPLDFLKEQLLITNPVLAIVWLAGLIGLLFSRRLRPWRAHGIAFLVSTGILVASGKSRASYMAPSYMLLMPAGGVMIESFVSSSWVWTRRLTLSAGAITSALLLPMSLPILPVDTLIRYQQALGFTPRAEEHAALGPLPQFMADRFGWREMAAAVDATYMALPADERARTYVFTRNYGEAAAIEYFSPALRGRVLSGHNNYYLWFPSGWDGSEILVIGDKEEDVRKAFADVQRVGVTDHPLAMPYERHLTVFLGRHPLLTLDQIRAAIKHFD